MPTRLQRSKPQRRSQSFISAASAPQEQSPRGGGGLRVVTLLGDSHPLCGLFSLLPGAQTALAMPPDVGCTQPMTEQPCSARSHLAPPPPPPLPTLCLSAPATLGGAASGGESEAAMVAAPRLRSLAHATAQCRHGMRGQQLHACHPSLPHCCSPDHGRLISQPPAPATGSASAGMSCSRQAKAAPKGSQLPALRQGHQERVTEASALAPGSRPGGGGPSAGAYRRLPEGSAEPEGNPTLSAAAASLKVLASRSMQLKLCGWRAWWAQPAPVASMISQLTTGGLRPTTAPC